MTQGRLTSGTVRGLGRRTDAPGGRQGRPSLRAKMEEGTVGKRHLSEGKSWGRKGKEINESRGDTNGKAGLAFNSLE